MGRWRGVMAAALLCSASAGMAQGEGLRIITDLRLGNCASCHALPSQAVAESGGPGAGLGAGAAGNFGPSLAGVGSRWTAAQLQQWVTDARALRADTLMPPFGTTQGLNRPAPDRPLLTPEQIRLVVQTLETWR